MKSVAGSGLISSWIPCVTETAAPATNRPTAASRDQTYASRPWPSGCARSGSRCDRRLATSRNTSLPVSAQECAASANIDADPVTTAAIDFATPTRKLAPKATHTVLALADTPERDTRERGPRKPVSPTRGSSSAARVTAEVPHTTAGPAGDVDDRAGFPLTA